MSIYRKQYKDRQGITQQSTILSIRFIDHAGRQREVSSGVSKKPLAQKIQAQIKSMVEYHRAGAPVPAEMISWANRQPESTRAKLAEWGIIPSDQAASMLPLDTLIDRWHLSLTTKGATLKHADQSRVALERAFTLGKATRWSDLDLPHQPVMQAIAEMDAHTNTKRHYWTAVVSFCLWGERTLNMPKPRLLMARPNWKPTEQDAATGRRRRCATPQEMDALIDAALTGEPHKGIPTDGWALAYELAVQTGFRLNELRTITPARCRLDSLPNRIVVGAAYAKSRKERGCDIRPQLAQRLRDYIERNQIDQDKPILPLPARHTAEVMRVHLKAAGIPFKDERGAVLDFHALRHTFLTAVARSTDIETARQLAGHSNITTTGKYMHTTSLRQREALDKLPEVKKGA